MLIKIYFYFYFFLYRLAWKATCFNDVVKKGVY